jgi:hypothetical protein
MKSHDIPLPEKHSQLTFDCILVQATGQSRDKPFWRFGHPAGGLAQVTRRQGEAHRSCHLFPDLSPYLTWLRQSAHSAWSSLPGVQRRTHHVPYKLLALPRRPFAIFLSRPLNPILGRRISPPPRIVPQASRQEDCWPRLDGRGDFGLACSTTSGSLSSLGRSSWTGRR